MTNNNKLFRIAAVPQSLNILLRGQLQFLSKHIDVTGISSAGEQLVETGNREGIQTIPLEIKRNIAPLSDLKSLYSLYRLFKKEKPDIVHSITPKAGLLSMIAAYFAGVPMRMHTFTGLIFPYKKGLFRKLLLNMDRLTCFFATNVYPEGEGVKQDLIKDNVTSKPLEVLANGNVNGINTSYFNPGCIKLKDREKLKFSLNIEPGDFVFIFVGRLVGDKGINELVDAFKQLVENNELRQQTKLLLVGRLETELDPLHETTMNEIESNPDILEVGYQEDVRPYFSISDVLTFPSYREGFPNVVMQAGAMGLPGIVTNINGCNEIIIEGKNGTIIPPKDIDALVMAMQRMLNKDKWRKSLQNNARDMITSRYVQEQVWEALLEEYNILLRKHNMNKC